MPTRLRTPRSRPRRTALRPRRSERGVDHAAARTAASRVPRRMRLRPTGRRPPRSTSRPSPNRRRTSRSPRSPSPPRSTPRAAIPTTTGTMCPCPSGATSSRGSRYTDARSRDFAVGEGSRFSTLMSYAIIHVGGKQYRVREGERLLVDRLKTDEGKTFSPRVLLVGGNGNTDLSPSTTVTARVVGHVLGDKIRIGRYKRRTGYRKHTGFRSSLTQIEIESIGAGARRRLEAEDARREDVLRAGRVVRDDPRSPARHAVPPGPRHGDRQGRHDLRDARRRGHVPDERRAPLHLGRRRRRGLVTPPA